MQWTRRHTIALAVTLAALAGAFALKHPCTTQPWRDDFQYDHYCYSDLLPIYGAHGHDRDLVPYLDDAPDGVNEYPVLTGFFSYVVGRMTTGLTEFMVVSYILLLACGAATGLAMWRIGGLSAALAWALAPALVIHGLTNWDLLAVVAAAWGWHEWVRGRPFSSALLFGLGGAAKLYPVFFLPLLFFGALAPEWPALRARFRAGADRAAAWVPKRTLKTLVGGTLGFAGPNLYVAARAPDNWMAIWRFHGGRSPDFETPWESFLRPLLQPLFPSFDWGEGWASFVGRFGLVALLLATAYFAYRTWKGSNPLATGSAVVLVFLLTNRVYSPQYTLWALPMLVLLHARRLPSVLFVLADLANFLVRYKLFTPPPGGHGWNTAWEPWSHFAVNARWVFLAWAAWTVVRRHGLVAWPPRRSPAVTASGAAAET